MKLFAESFDTFVTAQIPNRGWTIVVGSSTATAISAGNGRRSTQSLRLAAGAGNQDTGRVSFVPQDPAPSGATCICGLGFKLSTLPIVASTAEGSSQVLFAVQLGGVTHVWFRINVDGTLSAFRTTTLLGTSTFALSTGVYYFLEFKVTISDTVGVVQYRRDGALDATLNLASQDTNNGGATDTWNGIKLGQFNNGNLGASAVTLDYDDLYLFDGSGAYNTDFIGDSRVDAILANANGTSNMSTPLSGIDRYLMVDEALADDDITYNTLAAVNDKDTYNYAAHPVSGATISGMQVTVWGKKADAGTCLVTSVVRMSATDYDHAAPVAPSSDYRALRFVYNRSPVDGTTALTTADIDAMEVGPKKTA